MANELKAVKGPVPLVSVHSSGKSVAVSDGKNIYIDYGISGEEVTYLSHRRKQGFRSGEVVDIITPSPYRVEPFCKHHRECSGCPWQHIDHRHQLEMKHTILKEALEKYGITVPEIPPVIPAPGQKYFRHRVEYTFSSEGNALGYHKSGEPGQVTDIEECYLQQQPSRSVCEFIKSYALENKLSFYDHRHKTGFLRSLSIRINREGEALVVLGFAEDLPAERILLLESMHKQFPQIRSLNWTIHLSPAHSQLQGDIVPFDDMTPCIYEKSADLNFRVHASSFFQPNAAQAERIFKTIREWTGLTGYEKIYDLYTGVGTIALFLAPEAKEVLGIEGSHAAIEDAKENARLNNVPNATFMVGDILETFTPEFLQKQGKPDVIVLDPPRSGTLIEIKKTINNSGAARVIYLSCNPVSLAFDLKQLTEAYRVTRVQPFDMLPHTHHLETLVMLERV